MIVIKHKKEYPRIRELREDKDLNQVDVAQALGLHITQYQRYERGESTVPAYIIGRLAKFYNVSTDYIYEFTNSSTPSWEFKNNVSISGDNNKITFK